jgi:branched-chain amino acid transport system permease protein
MDYVWHILVMCGIYTILTLSLNLLIGYTGLPALGHAAFSCVGAYVSALLALNFGLSPWIGLVIGASVAAVVGGIVAFPALRLRGDYLALASFGFAVIVYSIAKNWIDVTRGPLGLPGIPGFSLFGLSISAVWGYLILVAVMVGITTLAISRIVGSPIGLVLRGIREDEIATMAMGKDVNYHKVMVFVVGAFFAGVAGSLYAHYISFIDPSSFTVTESITILLMVVFGGLGNVKGSFVGAVVLIVFPELLRFLGLPSSVAAPLRQMIYGLLLVGLMLYRPQGILGSYRFK